jgi:hypothetical protein
MQDDLLTGGLIDESATGSFREPLAAEPDQSRRDGVSHDLRYRVIGVFRSRLVRD